MRKEGSLNILNKILMVFLFFQALHIYSYSCETLKRKSGAIEVLSHKDLKNLMTDLQKMDFTYGLNPELLSEHLVQEIEQSNSQVFLASSTFGNPKFLIMRMDYQGEIPTSEILFFGSQGNHPGTMGSLIYQAAAFSEQRGMKRTVMPKPSVELDMVMNLWQFSKTKDGKFLERNRPNDPTIENQFIPPDLTGVTNFDKSLISLNPQERNDQMSFWLFPAFGGSSVVLLVSSSLFCKDMNVVNCLARILK